MKTKTYLPLNRLNFEKYFPEFVHFLLENGIKKTPESKLERLFWWAMFCDENNLS